MPATTTEKNKIYGSLPESVNQRRAAVHAPNLAPVGVVPRNSSSFRSQQQLLELEKQKAAATNEDKPSSIILVS